MSDIELKECPFCGGGAELKTLTGHKDKYGEETYWCQCPKCQMVNGDLFTKGAAILAWNARPENNLESQLQIAREALGKISNQAVCGAITPANEHIEMLQRIMEWSDEALSKITSMGGKDE